MSLRDLIRGKPAPSVATVASVAVAKAPNRKPEAQPFDPDAFEERLAICIHDGGLSREEAEAIAWADDDERRREAATFHPRRLPR
jgi:hypothetical protein